MARRKATLDESTQYQRLVLALRLTHLLCDEAVGYAAAVSVKTESNAAHGWDDIVERWRAGPEFKEHAWQVKRLELPMTRVEAEALFRSIVDLGDHKAVLGVSHSVHVATVGQLAQLRNLLKRIERDEHEQNLTREEKAWQKFVERVTERSLASIGAQLQVQILGDEDVLRDRMRSKLIALYRLDCAPIAATVEQFANALQDGIEVRADELEQRALAKFASERRIGVRMFPHGRRQYLEAVERVIAGRRVASGLFDDDVPLLSRVWIDTNESRVLPTGELVGDDLLRGALEGGRHLLVAEVGGGKTERLARLASSIARRAMDDPEAPLPLLLDAQRFVDAGDLFGAADAVFKDRLSSIQNLEHVRWVVIVDGLDEVAAVSVDALESALVDLGSRIHSFVGAARPTRRLPSTTIWHLTAWTNRDLATFLQHWAAATPALRGLLPLLESNLTIGGLMASPLLSTLGACVAARDPAVPSSRTRLFEQVVSHLFERWNAHRRGSMPWSDVAPSLRALARALIEGNGNALPRQRVEDLLRLHAPDQARIVEHSLEHDFGILVRGSNGTLGFALRSIAEFLAGEDLEQATDEELCAIAAQKWAEEPLRHAIGRMTVERARGLVTLLLERDLREFIVAMRSIADRDDLGIDVDAMLQKRIAEYLLDETSVWEGDRVADALAPLLAPFGARLHPVVEELGAALAREGSRSHFVASLAEPDPKVWWDYLLERDPQVRAVAIARLKPWIDQPDTRGLLVWSIYDEGREIGETPPALVAGLILRYAARDAAFAGVLRGLVLALRSGGQIRAAAAAIALRPGEADAEHLVTALREGAYAYAIPTVVLEELAETDAGRTALSTWPTWRADATRHAPIETGTAIEIDKCPSRFVASRLMRVVLPWAVKYEPSRISDAASADLHTAWALACEVALESPVLALRLLEKHRFVPLPLPSQQQLGHAATRHEDLCSALLTIARDLDPVHLALFPGYALEALVRVKAPGALDAYCRWLPYAPGFRGIGGHLPSFDMFSHPMVRSTCHEIARSVWVQARRRRDGSRLAAGSAGSILSLCRPAWSDDTSLRRALLKWLGGSDPERAAAAMTALSTLHLTSEERSTAVATLRRWIEQRSTNRVIDFSLQTGLQFVIACGLAPSLRAELEELGREDSVIGLSACTALTTDDGVDANAISAAVATRGIRHEYFFHAGASVERLVPLAPDAWMEAIVAFLRLPHAIIGGTAARVLALLPEKQRIAAIAARDAADLPLPWVSDDEFGLRTIRPWDALRRLRFDVGLPMPSDT